MSDRWFYRVFGQEFGPVSLDLVRTLVAAGTIAPDDEVRDANRSNWILACAASELRNSGNLPATDVVVERRAVRDEWFCRGAAGDFGPLTLSDLIQLAALGELKPDEDVKSQVGDYWKQLGSIRRLVELLPFPDPNFRRPIEAQLSIFNEDDCALEAENTNTATTTNLGDDRSLNRVACFQIGFALTVRDVESTLRTENHTRDDDADILLFPGVEATESACETLESSTTKSNRMSECVEAEGEQGDACLRGKSGGDRVTIGIENPACRPHPEQTMAAKPDLNSVLNKPRNDPRSIGILIVVYVGLIALAWIAGR